MSSLVQSSKESTLIRKKSQHKPNSLKTLSEFLLPPNLPVKRSYLIKQDELIQLNAQSNKTSRDVTSSTKKVRCTDHRRGISDNKKVEQPRSLILPQSEEYYPEKFKRKMPTRKIMLQPKHKYTVIASTNKRKRKIPHKEVELPPSAPELTMQELILAAEQQGIDDEDLLEILTCPSPVWWEDPVGQEEIYIRFHEDIDDSSKEQNKTSPVDVFKSHNNKVNIDSCDIKNKGALKNDINFFTKFVEKRSKLENILGYIKFKKTVPDEPKRSESKNKRKDSSSGISDASINEEELLNDLENIEIPVAQINNNKEEIIKDKEQRNVKVSNVKVKSLKKKDKSNNVQTLRRTTRIRKAKQVFEIDKTYTIPKKTKQRTSNDLENVPTELPPLTKNPFQSTSKFESPKSMDSTDTVSSVIEFDSISDTNIKFLDEYEEEKSNKIEIDSKDKSPKAEGDLVTVYRILPNDTEKVDIEKHIKHHLLRKDEQVNTDKKLNDKCKKSLKNKTKGDTTDVLEVSKDGRNEDDITPTKRAIRVANKKVTYCHKCCSIYVTESCQYCVKKNNKKSLKS